MDVELYFGIDSETPIWIFYKSRDYYGKPFVIHRW